MGSPIYVESVVKHIVYVAFPEPYYYVRSVVWYVKFILIPTVLVLHSRRLHYKIYIYITYIISWWSQA